jgi:hypothetical protein
MSERAGELLLKAIDGLAEPERDELLRQLLSGLVHQQHEHGSLPTLSLGRRARAAAYGRFVDQLSAEKDEAGAWKVVPIRLNADLYERLRAWSQDHDFPMAVVVRGLVERFLDSQAKGTAG